MPLDNSCVGVEHCLVTAVWNAHLQYIRLQQNATNYVHSSEKNPSQYVHWWMIRFEQFLRNYSAHIGVTSYSEHGPQNALGTTSIFHQFSCSIYKYRSSVKMFTETLLRRNWTLNFERRDLFMACNNLLLNNARGTRRGFSSYKTMKIRN